MLKRFLADSIEFNEPSTSKGTGKVTKVAKRKINNFNNAEKHALANEIKGQPAIWDLRSKEHSNTQAVNSAWRIISEKLGKPISDCKAVWMSLRESKRYRDRTAKKIKLEDAGGEALPQTQFDDSNVGWEFAADLSFLPDLRPKRKTLTSTSTFEVSDGPASAQIADCIERFVALQEQQNAASSQPNQPPLVHYAALANIDRMLHQLDSNAAEDVIFEMTSLCYAKIKECRTKNNQ